MIRRLEWLSGDGKVLRLIGRIVLVAIALALGYALGAMLVSPQYATVVTAVGVAFCLGAILVDPKIGMLLWIIIAPYARFIPLDIQLGHGIPDLKLSRLVTLVLLALWAAQMAIGRRKLSRVIWGDIFVALLMISTLVSYSGASMSTKTALQSFWDTWLVPALAYFLARQFFSTERDVKRIAITIAVVGLYLALLATHEQTTGIILFYPEDRSVVYTAHVRRVVNLLGNPAFTAMCLAVAAPLAARGMVESKTRNRRLVWLGVLLALAVGSFMCYNRAGWAAFIASLLVMLPFYPRFRKVFLPVFLAAAMLLIVAWGAVSATPAIRERLRAEGPIAWRMQVLGTAWKMIKANPLIGVGQGNFATQYTLYARGAAYQYADPNPRVLVSPHNSFVYILVHGGLLALLPYLGFMLSAFWVTVRFYRSVRDAKARSLIVATWGAFVGHLLPAMAGDLVLFPFGSVLFYVLIGGVLGWILGEGQALIAPREPAEGAA
ncbi:MAG: O-antigen ligase family protein [Anaerolineae bacterium]|nr:O-antigen ligase family protein [Anaerolineae bacterium]